MAPEKRDFLFRFVSPSKRERLRFDDASLYSTTDQLTADKITKDLLRFVPPTATVTDATACVGGSTFSLSRSFAKVQAIEVDPLRFEHLEHNMEVLGASNVRCILGDVLDICPMLRQDVVFLDPPWGGPEYKTMLKVSLHLSSMPLHEICRRIAPCTPLLAIKVPTNFDEEAFIENTKTFMVLLHKNTQLRKMHLLIFRCVHSPPSWTVFQRKPRESPSL
jgi:16S rRNA G966 N2-methylase RsmD